MTAEIVWPRPDRSMEELFGSAVGTRQPLELLPSLLASGEKVLTGATAFLDGRSGIVVATNRRLLFLHRDELLVDAEYPAIRHFRALAGLVVADLQLETDERRAVIKQIHPRTRLAELAELLGHSPGTSAG